MQRLLGRKQPLDNQHNKRWSTSFIENNDKEEEEKISSQSAYLTLLTNKLGISREKALVNIIINTMYR